MKRYVNAKDVLPDHLVREIQKYVQGQQVYIPRLAERYALSEERIRSIIYETEVDR